MQSSILTEIRTAGCDPSESIISEWSRLGLDSRCFHQY